MELPANVSFSGLELYQLGGQLYERELSKLHQNLGVPVGTSLGAMPGLGCLQRCDIALPV